MGYWQEFWTTLGSTKHVKIFPKSLHAAHVACSVMECRKCEVNEKSWRPVQSGMTVEISGHGKQDVEAVKSWKNIQMCLGQVQHQWAHPSLRRKLSEIGMELLIAADLFSDPDLSQEKVASISRTIQFSTGRLETILSTSISPSRIETSKHF